MATKDADFEAYRNAFLDEMCRINGMHREHLDLRKYAQYQEAKAAGLDFTEGEGREILQHTRWCIANDLYKLHGGGQIETIFRKFIAVGHEDDGSQIFAALVLDVDEDRFAELVAKRVDVYADSVVDGLADTVKALADGLGVPVSRVRFDIVVLNRDGDDIDACLLPNFVDVSERLSLRGGRSL